MSAIAVDKTILEEWGRVCNLLKQEVGIPFFKRWFLGVLVDQQHTNENTIYLSVPHTFLAEHFLHRILAVWRKVRDGEVRVELKMRGYNTATSLPKLVRSREVRALEQKKSTETFPVIRVAIENIQQAVAAHSNVSTADLLSPMRFQEIVRARHIAMYLSRILTSGSLPEIGRCFAGKHHATVLHGIVKITASLKTDPELAATIELLKRQLVVK